MGRRANPAANGVRRFPASGVATPEKRRVFGATKRFFAKFPPAHNSLAPKGLRFEIPRSSFDAGLGAENKFDNWLYDE